MRILVKRKKKSLLYLKDPTTKVTWDNAAWVNMQDTLYVYGNDNSVMLKTPCQTVSNTEGLLPGCTFLDTLAPGEFYVKPFVAQRNFYGRIHGIIDASTLRGDIINKDSVTLTNKSRWLIHDTQKGRVSSDGRTANPPMTLTSRAWSGGCIVLTPKGLEDLGRIFDNAKITNADTVPGRIEMED